METTVNSQQLLLLGVKTNNLIMVREALALGANLDTVLDDMIRYAIQNNNSKFLSFLIEKGYSEKINYSRAFFLAAKYNNDFAFTFFLNYAIPPVNLVSIVKTSTTNIKNSFSEKTGILF